LRRTSFREQQHWRYERRDRCYNADRWRYWERQRWLLQRNKRRLDKLERFDEFG
jgi:hypothetical protein